MLTEPPLAVRLLPDSFGAQERLDLLGVTLLTGGVMAMVWALVRADQSGWASAEIIGGLVGGVILLLAFTAWERHASEPMVPPRLFRSRAFAAGNATTFLMIGAIFAAGFLVTRSSSSPGATHRSRPGYACSPSSPRRCSSHRSRAPLRPHRPPAGHGDRALHAGRRAGLGRHQGLARDELDRA